MKVRPELTLLLLFLFAAWSAGENARIPAPAPIVLSGKSPLERAYLLAYAHAWENPAQSETYLREARSLLAEDAPESEIMREKIESLAKTIQMSTERRR